MRDRQNEFHEINLTDDALLNKISTFTRNDGLVDVS